MAISNTPPTHVGRFGAATRDCGNYRFDGPKPFEPP